MKRANRSEEGQGQERTEKEPDGERDYKGEEQAGISARAIGAGLGGSQRLTLAQVPRFTQVSRSPVHPQSQSCWPCICSGSFLC